MARPIKSKQGIAAQAQPRCQRLAQELGYELVDIETERDDTGLTLRVFIDRPEGMDMDGCERYHRALIPLVESLDYDYLEVSSAGIDRPLKRDRDFERNLGSEVEVRFFRPVDGAKELQGILADWDAETVTLEIGGSPRVLPRKDCALIRPVVDLSGVEEVEFTDEDDAAQPAESEPIIN